MIITDQSVWSRLTATFESANGCPRQQQ